MRVSLRTKLVVAVTVPALVVCALVITVTFMRLRTRAILRLEENATRIAALYADRMAAELSGVAALNEGMGAYLEGHAELGEEQALQMLEAGVAASGLVEALAAYRQPSPAEQDARPPWSGLLLQAPERQEAAALSRWPEVQSVPGWYSEAQQAGEGLWISAPRAGPLTGPARVVYARVWPDSRSATHGLGMAAEIDVGRLRQRLGNLLTGTDLALVDQQGHYLYHPGPEELGADSIYELAARSERPDVALLGQRMAEGESGVMRLRRPGEDQYQWVVFAPVPGTTWSFAYALPETRVLAFPNSQLLVGGAIAGGGLLLMAGFIYVVVSRSTAPLQRLVGAVDRIAGGDLGARVEEIRTHDEIGDLARSFNRMVGDLRRYMETHTRELAARESVESELRVARRIQNSLLPGRFPAYPDRPEFELHAVNMPAAQVAGDFFDFFLRDRRTLVLVMADVSGKGIPAALFMAVARTVIRNLTPHCNGPAATLRRANEVLREDNMGSMYVTLFLGWYDTVSGRLRYANAGHPRPYKVDGAGTATRVGEVSGPMLGILPDLEYSDGEVKLEPGESLVLYTDGLSEARDPAGEFFGFERLGRLIESHAAEPVDHLCETVARAVGRFQDREQRDDITLLALRRGPQGVGNGSG